MSVLTKAKDKYQADGMVGLIKSIPGYMVSRRGAFVPEAVRQKYQLSNRDELHSYWKSRSDNDRNSPSDYLDSIERSQFLLDLISPYVDKRNQILEPGCNVGRNLNYLYSHGFDQLSGIEINPDAVEMLKTEHPDLASEADIYQGEIENIITEFESGEFDIVFTMAVLEHIHPDSEFIFEEIARVADEYIVTIEDEASTSHRHVPRNYKDIFTQFDFELIKTLPGQSFPDNVELAECFVARVFRKSD
jgi:SAM-dependent methyltransferase